MQDIWASSHNTASNSPAHSTGRRHELGTRHKGLAPNWTAIQHPLRGLQEGDEDEDEGRGLGEGAGGGQGAWGQDEGGG